MTQFTRNDIIAARLKFEERFDALVKSAEALMALADLKEPDAPGGSPEWQEFEDHSIEVYEERFHCEVCIVRNVLETVYPAVDEYVATLEKALGFDDSDADTTTK
jgi:hypothetical protein